MNGLTVDGKPQNSWKELPLISLEDPSLQSLYLTLDLSFADIEAAIHAEASAQLAKHVSLTPDYLNSSSVDMSTEAASLADQAARREAEISYVQGEIAISDAILNAYGWSDPPQSFTLRKYRDIEEGTLNVLKSHQDPGTVHSLAIFGADPIMAAIEAQSLAFAGLSYDVSTKPELTANQMGQATMLMMGIGFGLYGMAAAETLGQITYYGLFTAYNADNLHATVTGDPTLLGRIDPKLNTLVGLLFIPLAPRPVANNVPYWSEPTYLPIDVSIPQAPADFTGPTIGPYRTTAEFRDAVYDEYQRLVDQGYAVTMNRVNQELIPNNSTIIGSEVDTFARDGLRQWLWNSVGIQEGPGQIIAVNRRLYEPLGSGAYRIPDVYISATGDIFDATVGFKDITWQQIIDFQNFSGGGNITIVRPILLPVGINQPPGSYGLFFP